MQWEYETYSPDPDTPSKELIEGLNDCGENGWELVTTLMRKVPGKGPQGYLDLPIFVFKRPRKPASA